MEIYNSIGVSKSELILFDKINQLIKESKSIDPKIRDFGVSLMHEHFKIKEDEILLENNNPFTRELNTKVVSKDEINSNHIATEWYFVNDKILVNSFCCDPGGGTQCDSPTK